MTDANLAILIVAVAIVICMPSIIILLNRSSEFSPATEQQLAHNLKLYKQLAVTVIIAFAILRFI